MKLAFYIISIICFGITNCLWVFPIRKLSILSTIIYRTLITSSLFGLILLLNYSNVIVLKHPFIIGSNHVSAFTILETFFICSINFFGLYFYLKCIKEMPVALTVGIQKLGVVFSICFGIFIYHETVSLVEWLCFAVLLFAALIIEGASFKFGRQLFSRGFTFCILALFFWSTSVLFKPLLQELGVILFSFILEISVLVMAILLNIYSKNKSFQKPDGNTILYLITIALFGFFGVMGINVALEGLPISFLSIIGLIGPCTSLLIAVFILKEKVILRQWIGIGMCIICGLILSLANLRS